MSRLAEVIAACAAALALSGCQSGAGGVLHHDGDDGQATVRYDKVLYTPDELAALFVGRSVLVYDPRNGNEVTYYAEGGGATLWHPTQDKAVPGAWRLQGGRELCTRFGAGGFNPITREPASTYVCEPLASFERRVIGSEPGDVFGLSDGAPPRALRKHPGYPSLQAVREAAGG